MRLQAWTSVEAEDLLSGPAEILRRTYFGELVLTPDALRSIHDVAVAPIRRRWNPEVHQVIDAERAIRRRLGEPDNWKHLWRLGSLLIAEAQDLTNSRRGLPTELAENALTLASTARTFGTNLLETLKCLEGGDLDALQNQIALRPSAPDRILSTVPRHLRSCKHPSGIVATNALSDCHRARAMLNAVGRNLGIRIIAVKAEAGCGKTELAAQLTSASENRPAGILLHGRQLGASDGLDDLAKTIEIHGIPVPSMEALVAALDAAGRRSHRRLPIVIDGLNEAEDPRVWKPLLASAAELASRYPYVLIVCTLRTEFATEALPPELPTLEIPDFQQDAEEAIARYFKYYRIDPSDALFPIRLLRHPLTLRLFCEVANPKRERVVGIEALPSSLTALFDRYIEQVSERITELTPREWRYYGQDVKVALDQIGYSLWEQRTRALDFNWLRQQLGENTRPWNTSLVGALEQEGLLIRVRERGSTADGASVVYDLLAGHLIATSVLTRFGRDGFQAWLKDATTEQLLMGPLDERHPLSTDIFKALVGLVPRRLGQQLWPLLEGHARTATLIWAAQLEAAHLDSATVAELAGLLRSSRGGHQELCKRLWSTRGSHRHPLNVNFLDDALRKLSVCDRDSGWTQWVLANGDEAMKDLESLEAAWRDPTHRLDGDYLRAQWVMWTLCSTSRKIRDQATATLYWFGRGDPDALFRLTLSSLSIGDPYVPERMLASSYGVVMAHQIPDPKFELSLRDFLTGLRDAFVGPRATDPTDHWLERLYIQGCVTFALKYYARAVPEGLQIKGTVPFSPGAPVELEASDARAPELDKALIGYYEDKTLDNFIGFGSHGLRDEIRDRALAHLRGTLDAFGWSESPIAAFDKHAASDRYFTQKLLLQKYIEKYAWIGLYTFPQMPDYYRFWWEDRRPPDLQIDPSFPVRVPRAPLSIPAWASEKPADDRRWIRCGKVQVPDELFYSPRLGSDSGPWLLVDGHLNSRIKVPNRGVFGLIAALLVDPKDADRLLDELVRRPYPGNRWLPEAPEDHYTFSGEIPWSPEFAAFLDTEEGGRIYRETIDVDNGLPLEVEALSHDFAWESYHSTLNQAGGALVPSKRFSQVFDLRGIPQSFDQFLPDGTKASLSLHGPREFSGSLLYLREDLVLKYAAGRKLVWFAWGERTLYGYLFPNAPDWLAKIHQTRQMIWRRALKGEELSPAFREQRRPRTKKSKRLSKKRKGLKA